MITAYIKVEQKIGGNGGRFITVDYTEAAVGKAISEIQKLVFDQNKHRQVSIQNGSIRSASH